MRRSKKTKQTKTKIINKTRTKQKKKQKKNKPDLRVYEKKAAPINEYFQANMDT